MCKFIFYNNKMNIFFLSFDVDECAQLYCDQHVNKILLEIVQMLYTAWHKCGDITSLQRAPRKKNSDQRGYKSVSNPNHPMVRWVRSHNNNYKFTAKLGMALAIEFHHRFGKIHACTKHVMWLYSNVPHGLVEDRSDTAYYPTEGFPSYLTPIPECIPEIHRDPHLLRANFKNYYYEKFPFSRFGRYDSVYRFKAHFVNLGLTFVNPVG